jgi:7,8-dihydropterin-6-yl-methyl-4-(beta-D-ribofuranosyl)aminobenzene 5'-phosphate synthase
MDRGLVVLTGCAHSGIINTLRHAQKITGIDKVCAVVGGFHLDKADDEKIEASIDELVKINPTSIYPCHCTGSKATRKLLDSFGDRCKPVQTGDVIEV